MQIRVPRMEIWLPQVEVQGRLTTKCRDMHCSNLFPVPQSQKSTRAPATYLQVPPLPSAVEAMGGHAPNGVVASPQTIPNKENPSRRPVTGLSLAVPTSTHPPSPFQRMVPETLEPWNLASQLSPSSLPLFFFHCVPHCVSDCVSRQEDPGSCTRKQCYVLGVDWMGWGGGDNNVSWHLRPSSFFLLAHSPLSYPAQPLLPCSTSPS